MFSLVMVGLLAMATYHFLGPIGLLVAFGILFFANKK